MASYSVLVKRSVYKTLSALSKADVKRLTDAMRRLADDPHPPQSKRLTNDERYRLRVGDYRILYTVENEVLVVTVVKVGHRREVYR
ncbi:MAG: type II toxin-antitoxin system RelE/ParE family toxin [bacterium]